MGKVPGYTVIDICNFPTQTDLKEYGFSERMCAYQCQNKNQPERVDLHVMVGSCNDDVLHIDDWYRVDVFEELMSKLGAIMTEWYISKHRSHLPTNELAGMPPRLGACLYAKSREAYGRVTLLPD